MLSRSELDGSAACGGHPIVRDAERLGQISGLLGHEHRAVGAPHGEALPHLRERGGGALDEAAWAGGDGLGEDADLVAAEPVGAAVAGDCVGEPARDTTEQRVAGGVAERVVVGLEAVEVEDDENDRILAALEEP